MPILTMNESIKKLPISLLSWRVSSLILDWGIFYSHDVWTVFCSPSTFFVYISANVHTRGQCFNTMLLIMQIMYRHVASAEGAGRACPYPPMFPRSIHFLKFTYIKLTYHFKSINNPPPHEDLHDFVTFAFNRQCTRLRNKGNKYSF